MEGQPLLARRLLKQRADGNVRLRDDVNQKVIYILHLHPHA